MLARIAQFMILPTAWAALAATPLLTALWLLLAAAPTLLFAAAPTANAQEDGVAPAPEVAIQDVVVGVGGHFKAGNWTPIRVTLQVPPGPFAGRVEVETIDSDGVSVIYSADSNTAAPREPASDGRLQVTVYARFGRQRGELIARVRGDSRVWAQRRFRAEEVGRGHPPQQLVLVSLGEPWVTEESLRSIERVSQSVSLVVLDDVAQLPDRWLGWEGVDAVLLSTSSRQFVEDLPETAFSALDEWLRLGGRLVWSVGERGNEVLAKESRFSAWSPGTFVEVGTLRRTSALESFAGSAQRLELNDADGRPRRIAMTLLDDARGRVEIPEGGLSSGDRPQVIRYPLGLGQATLITLDLDQPPLAEWGGRARVLTRILSRGREPAADASSDQLGKVAHLGFDDLSGQLRGSLDQFSGVTVVAFSWIVAILVVYILLIGPGDYFLVRFLGRPHWTWITVALTASTFVLLTYLLAARWQEKRVRVNVVQIVDIDGESGRERGTAWFNIYSPRSDRYSLELSSDERKPKTETVLLGWQGLPGKGLGGLGASNVATLLEEVYRIETRDNHQSIADLPIQVGATKSLSARWSHERRVDLTDNGLYAVSLDERLQGECRYPLDVALNDWFLMYGNWLYRGDRRLMPGDTISLSDFSVTRYLDWHLTRRTVSTDHKDVSTPWDQAEQNVPRILELLLFHEAAGGSAYSRLQHRYQSYLDLSDHLRTGRAILMGRAERPARELLRGDVSLESDTENQWTYYRVVFPVSPRKPSPSGARRAEN